MLKSFADIFKIPELKKRVLFTLGVIAVYRLGAAIPIPGVNALALKSLFDMHANSLLGFMDMFSGGALNKLSIFSMGIMPYINASIIMSLMQGVHQPGKMAAWIAPPDRGINNNPVDYEYVKLH